MAAVAPADRPAMAEKVVVKLDLPAQWVAVRRAVHKQPPVACPAAQTARLVVLRAKPVRTAAQVALKAVRALVEAAPRDLRVNQADKAARVAGAGTPAATVRRPVAVRKRAAMPKVAAAVARVP